MCAFYINAHFNKDYVHERQFETSEVFDSLILEKDRVQKYHHIFDLFIIKLEDYFLIFFQNPIYV